MGDSNSVILKFDIATAVPFRVNLIPIVNITDEIIGYGIYVLIRYVERVRYNVNRKEQEWLGTSYNK